MHSGPNMTEKSHDIPDSLHKISRRQVQAGMKKIGLPACGWFNPDLLNPSFHYKKEDSGWMTTSDGHISLSVKKFESECKVITSSASLFIGGKRAKTQRRRKAYRNCQSSNSWAPLSLHSAYKPAWPSTHDLIPGDSLGPLQLQPKLASYHQMKMSVSNQKKPEFPRSEGSSSEENIFSNLIKFKKLHPNIPNLLRKTTTVRQSSTVHNVDVRPESDNVHLIDNECLSLFPNTNVRLTTPRFKPTIPKPNLSCEISHATVRGHTYPAAQTELKQTDAVHSSREPNLTEQSSPVTIKEPSIVIANTYLQSVPNLHGPEINPLNNIPFFDHNEFSMNLENLEIRRFNQKLPFFEKKTSLSNLSSSLSCADENARNEREGNQNTSPEMPENEGTALNISYNLARSNPKNEMAFSTTYCQLAAPTERQLDITSRKTTCLMVMAPLSNATRYCADKPESFNETPLTDIWRKKFHKSMPLDPIALHQHGTKKNDDASDVQRAGAAMSPTTVILNSTSILNTTVMIQSNGESANPSIAHDRSVGSKVVVDVQPIAGSTQQTSTITCGCGKCESDLMQHTSDLKIESGDGNEEKLKKLEIKQILGIQKLRERKSKSPNKITVKKRVENSLTPHSLTCCITSEVPNIQFEERAVSTIDLVKDPKPKNQVIWVPSSYFNESHRTDSCLRSSSSESHPDPDMISNSKQAVHPSDSLGSCNTFVLDSIRSTHGNETSDSSSTQEVHLGDTQYFLPALTKNEQKILGCIQPLRRGDRKVNHMGSRHLMPKSVSCRSLWFPEKLNNKYSSMLFANTRSHSSVRGKGPRFLKVVRPPGPSHSALSVGGLSKAVDEGKNRHENRSASQKPSLNIRRHNQNILLLPSTSTENSFTTDGIMTFELDPIFALRIPSFELIPYRAVEGRDEVREIGKKFELDLENQWRRDLLFKTNGSSASGSRKRTCISNSFAKCCSFDILIPSTFVPSQESLKVMREAERFLTEYRKPGSPPFVHKLRQFAAYYDRLSGASAEPEIGIAGAIVHGQFSTSSFTNNYNNLRSIRAHRRSNYDCKLSRCALCLSFCRRQFSINCFCLRRVLSSRSSARRVLVKNDT